MAPTQMNGSMRLLFVGDVVGPTGRAAIQTFVPSLRRELALDAVIANGENSADNGFGASAETATELLEVVDFLTLGDHAFDQSDLAPMLDSNPRIIRPANFEGGHPGRGWGTFMVASVTIGVANLLGKAFMRPAVTSAVAAADQAIQALQEAGARAIMIDVQAEATSEKQGMGWYLAGRVAAVLGTHTHVPTADLRILPGGTAYVTDVGMTGGRDGVIGFDRDWLLRSMVTGERPGEPRPAGRPMKLDAVLLEIDASSGRAIGAERVFKED
jgi:2',3'-cyclic-nucleotide 2'-phosphodiesterase